jgi:hypothetical protein
MKKRLLILIICLPAVWSYGYTQTLSATVYDATTKQAIAGVNVYLDGTSIHTTTNAHGQFRLNVEKQINTSLIISHVAYDLVSIADPFTALPDKIYVKEKTNVLDEAVVFSTFTRKQMLTVFREQFLGPDKAGKGCRILNEDDIILSYDYENNILSASAKNPVIVENDYLAYTVSFNLITFYVTYKSKTLDSDWIKQTAYFGTSSFIDKMPNDRRTRNRRDEAYKHSSISFFKNLSNNTLKESKWQLFHRGFQVDPIRYFTVKDTLSLKLLHIRPDSNINTFVPGYKVAGKMSVLYNKKLQSDIVFLQDSYFIDEYGNISDPQNIFFSGKLCEIRLGNMLPIEYAPEK